MNSIKFFGLAVGMVLVGMAFGFVMWVLQIGFWLNVLACIVLLLTECGLASSYFEAKTTHKGWNLFIGIMVATALNIILGVVVASGWSLPVIGGFVVLLVGLKFGVYFGLFEGYLSELLS